MARRKKETDILSQEEIDALLSATSEPFGTCWETKFEIKGGCRVCGGDVVERVEEGVVTNNKTGAKKISAHKTEDLHCLHCGLRYKFLAEECRIKRMGRSSKDEIKQLQKDQERMKKALKMIKDLSRQPGFIKKKP